MKLKNNVIMTHNPDFFINFILNIKFSILLISTLTLSLCTLNVLKAKVLFNFTLFAKKDRVNKKYVSRIRNNTRFWIRDHLFSTFAKFSEKLTFLTP